jgi:lysine 2,3-aminomutase
VPLEEAARRLGHADAPWRDAARAFPVRWPAGYLALAERPGGEAIRRMGVPDPSELRPDPGDLADPVGESRRSAVPFVVQKHADRAILLVTARCHFYCRFCFRRSFPGGDHRDPTAAQLDAALDHLLGQPGLREVILSGGDPLVLPDERLAAIVARIRRAAQVETVRVHTRAPVHYPERVTDELVRLLAAAGPAWVVVHFDHPAELHAAALGAVGRLVDAGVPVLDQSVLLAGVNDDPDVLAELCRGLYRARVKPYYLHHPDRAPGNARFRVTVPRGLSIYRDLRKLLSGPALPAYVIDLPDGTGKVPVESLIEVAPGRWARADGTSAFDDVPG